MSAEHDDVSSEQFVSCGVLPRFWSSYGLIEIPIVEDDITASAQVTQQAQFPAAAFPAWSASTRPLEVQQPLDVQLWQYVLAWSGVSGIAAAACSSRPLHDAASLLRTSPQLAAVALLAEYGPQHAAHLVYGVRPHTGRWVLPLDRPDDASIAQVIQELQRRGADVHSAAGSLLRGAAHCGHITVARLALHLGCFASVASAAALSAASHAASHADSCPCLWSPAHSCSAAGLAARLEAQPHLVFALQAAVLSCRTTIVIDVLSYMAAVRMPVADCQELAGLLDVAAGQGCPALVEALLTAGWHPDGARRDMGPLSVACRAADRESVRMLLNWGAGVFGSRPTSPPAEGSSVPSSSTSSSAAASVTTRRRYSFDGRASAMPMLASPALSPQCTSAAAGASSSAPERLPPTPPPYVSALNFAGDAAVAVELLTMRPQLQQQRVLDSALVAAAEAGNDEVVEVLVGAGARAAGFQNGEALIRAIVCGHAHVVWALLCRAGAHVHLYGTRGSLLLLLARMWCNKEVCDVLRRCGARDDMERVVQPGAPPSRLYGAAAGVTSGTEPGAAAGAGAGQGNPFAAGTGGVTAIGGADVRVVAGNGLQRGGTSTLRMPSERRVVEEVERGEQDGGAEEGVGGLGVCGHECDAGVERDCVGAVESSAGSGRTLLRALGVLTMQPLGKWASLWRR